MDYVKQHDIFTARLPNKHNLVFNYYFVLWVLLATYIPGGPYMFGHMARQRKKELSGVKPVVSDKKQS